jgi:hypothetical protein
VLQTDTVAQSCRHSELHCAAQYFYLITHYAMVCYNHWCGTFHSAKFACASQMTPPMPNAHMWTLSQGWFSEPPLHSTAKLGRPARGLVINMY